MKVEIRFASRQCGCKEPASAPAVVPPFAVMNAAFHEPSNEVSNVMSYDPLVTPAGKPGNVGVVVATSAVPTPGIAERAMYMCDRCIGG